MPATDDNDTIRPGWRRWIIGITQRFCDVVETVEIGIEHGVPGVVGQRGKSRIARDARVEDQTIVGAVFGDIGFDRRAGLCAVGTVEGDQARGAPQCAHRIGNLAGLGFALAIMHDDIEAIARKTLGDRAADAAAGTGDENGVVHDAEE